MMSGNELTSENIKKAKNNHGKQFNEHAKTLRCHSLDFVNLALSFNNMDPSCENNSYVRFPVFGLNVYTTTDVDEGCWIVY